MTSGISAVNAVEGELAELAASFKQFDKDDDGYLTLEELTSALQHLDMTGCVNERRCSSLLQDIDVNSDNQVNFQEFLSWVWGNSNEESKLMLHLVGSSMAPQAEGLFDEAAALASRCTIFPVDRIPTTWSLEESCPTRDPKAEWETSSKELARDLLLLQQIRSLWEDDEACPLPTGWDGLEAELAQPAQQLLELQRVGGVLSGPLEGLLARGLVDSWGSMVEAEEMKGALLVARREGARPPQVVFALKGMQQGRQKVELAKLSQVQGLTTYHVKVSNLPTKCDHSDTWVAKLAEADRLLQAIGIEAVAAAAVDLSTKLKEVNTKLLSSISSNEAGGAPGENGAADPRAAERAAAETEEGRKILECFRKFDTDDSGTITREELQAVLGKVFKTDELPHNAYKIDLILEAMDTNNDGVINYEEFVQWVTGGGSLMEDVTGSQNKMTPIMKYCDIKALHEALRTGDTVLLHASWIVRCAASGVALPRRQDLPREAICDPEELFREAEWSDFRLKPRIVVVSYCWLTAKHPDPYGQQLRILARFLKATGVNSAVFIDYCSLHQRPRSKLEESAFKNGLKNVNLWYAHCLTWKVLLTKPRVGKTFRGYDERGWPNFERAISGMITDYDMVIDLGFIGSVRARLPTLGDFKRVCRARRGPPTLPDDFAEKLKTLHFTNGKVDCGFVEQKYRRTFAEVMGNCHMLDFSNLKWSDEEARQLATCLSSCACLKILLLRGNEITDEGAEVLAEAVQDCHSLKNLDLCFNSIGQAGLDSLRCAWERAGKKAKDLTMGDQHF